MVSRYEVGRGGRRRRVGCLLGLGIAALVGGVGGTWLASGGWQAARVTVGVAVVGGDFVRRPSLLEPLRPSPRFEGEPPPPGSPAAARVLATLGRVESTLQRTRYQHRTRVREARGEYYWDCSGMAGWVLARAAPRARRTLGRGRPVARTFARTIARAPTDRPRRGWQRIDDLADVRPGDLFAWERPPNFPSRDSGHVGFVVHRPVRIADDLFAVRILDSTSLPHQDDSRSGEATGTGRGTMTFVTDGEGHAEAYGWHGTRSLGHIETAVVFGRPH